MTWYHSAYYHLFERAVNVWGCSCPGNTHYIHINAASFSFLSSLIPLFNVIYLLFFHFSLSPFASINYTDSLSVSVKGSLFTLLIPSLPCVHVSYSSHSHSLLLHSCLMSVSFSAVLFSPFHLWLVWAQTTQIERWRKGDDSRETK